MARCSSAWAVQETSLRCERRLRTPAPGGAPAGSRPRPWTGSSGLYGPDHHLTFDFAIRAMPPGIDGFASTSAGRSPDAIQTTGRCAARCPSPGWDGADWDGYAPGLVSTPQAGPAAGLAGYATTTGGPGYGMFIRTTMGTAGRQTHAQLAGASRPTPRA